MKNIRNAIFYIGTIGFFSLIIYLVLSHADTLEAGRKIVLNTTGTNQLDAFTDTLRHNLGHPLAILLAQVITIILVARLFGWLFRKIGQPTVIGEIIAGIVLGPSLLGLAFPGISAALFPVQSLGNLQFLSQIGLILFMFVIGMELDLKVLRNQANDAVIISHASIIIPFTLGIILAFFIYESFAPATISFLSFGLFMGIAMSITAFPVLARIIQERGIHKTKLGTVVITCAAADDITAWCILAAVIAIVKAGSFVSSLYTILLAAGYVVLMIRVVRPFLARVGELHTSREQLSKPVVAIFFLTLLLSSYATEVIGIHALFGAFMAGAVMPGNAKFRNLFTEKVEDVASVLLLPLFFVFTGLRTQIGLLNDPGLWQITGIIILVAVLGKFAGSAAAARFVGQSWRDSLAIGALMNTRGLMELVVLNIGYDLGVLAPEMFAMMVIMALVTTFMTGPALDLINRVFGTTDAAPAGKPHEADNYKILFSFDHPESGRALMVLANSLTDKHKDSATVTALHVSPAGDLHYFDEQEYEQESFGPVIEASHQLGQRITTLFKASDDIDDEIINVANSGGYNLLLIGLKESIFEGSLLGRILGFTGKIINPGKILNTLKGKESWFSDILPEAGTRSIMEKSRIPSGVLIDKGLGNVTHVLLPLVTPADLSLVFYVRKLVHNADARVTVLDTGAFPLDPDTRKSIKAAEQGINGRVTLHTANEMTKVFLGQFDLVLVSLSSWKRLAENKTLWLTDLPSTLIIRHT